MSAGHKRFDLIEENTRHDDFTCGMISPKMTRTTVERMKPTSPEVSSEMMMDVREMTATLPKRSVQSKRFPGGANKRHERLGRLSSDSLWLFTLMLHS